MSKRFGVILAGGAGERLGHIRKSDIRVGGQRLIDRAIGSLRDETAEIAVSVAADSRIASLSNVTLIPDESEKRMGPLAGLAAALRHFSISARDNDVLIFLAVDTPFAPSDFVSRLSAAALSSGAAVAAWRNQLYPTNSAFTLAALKYGITLAPQTSGPKAVLAALGATTIDWADAQDKNPFANLNTLPDLIALQRRALRRDPAPLRQHI